MASERPAHPLADLTEPDSPITYGVVKPGPEDSLGVLFIRGGDIADGRILTPQLRTITKEISEQYRRTLLRGGELIVSLVGNPGQVALVPASLKGANIARQVGLVRLAKETDPRFVKYFLASPAGQEALGAHSRGSVQQVINLRDLKTVRIPLPSYSEQRAIADFLSNIDDRIDLLRQTNATLESIAQALFKSWFIDFDPVRAKAEGREPEGMDPATAALFPSEFEESPLGPIPKGWTVSSLAEQCAIQIGGVWGEEARTDKASVEVCCLRGIDAVGLAQGDLPAPPVRWVSPKQIKSRNLQIGDILIEGSGSFCGRSLLWVDSYKELMPLTPTYSNFVKRLAAPLGPHYARWIQRHLNGVYQSGEVKNYRTGSAFPNLDLSGMLSVIRVVPSAELLLRFDELAGGFEDSKAGRTHQAASLAALRDTLLPRFISGKLRLPDAEAAVEAMA